MSVHWQPYYLVYRTKSPLHIGHYKLGYIQRTRYYISGRSMWGAITANLTRAYYSYPDYEAVGTDVHDQILFSYFFPALDPQKPLLPEFTDTGLRIGSMPIDKFESMFIKAFEQTAIEPSVNAAQDETLHETEFICPMVSDHGKNREVFFVGHLFLREGARIAGSNITWDKLKSAIEVLSIGGERKYGFGRLVLENTASGKLVPAKDDVFRVFGHRLDLNRSDNLKIEIEQGQPVPAHLECKGCLNLRGDIEPLVGREWRSLVVENQETKEKNEIGSGAGQMISGAHLCWVPGSLMQEHKTLRIDRYGLLVVEGG